MFRGNAHKGPQAGRHNNSGNDGQPRDTAALDIPGDALQVLNRPTTSSRPVRAANNPASGLLPVWNRGNR